jgi:hypothetical protein
VAVAIVVVVGGGIYYGDYVMQHPVRRNYGHELAS